MVENNPGIGTEPQITRDPILLANPEMCVDMPTTGLPSKILGGVNSQE